MRVLRLKEVIFRVGFGRSTIYLRIRGGNFPAPIKLGKRSVGWLESVIDDWLLAREQTSSSLKSTGTIPKRAIGGLSEAMRPPTELLHITGAESQRLGALGAWIQQHYIMAVSYEDVASWCAKDCGRFKESLRAKLD